MTITVQVKHVVMADMTRFKGHAKSAGGVAKCRYGPSPGPGHGPSDLSPAIGPFNFMCVSYTLRWCFSLGLACINYCNKI